MRPIPRRPRRGTSTSSCSSARGADLRTASRRFPLLFLRVPALGLPIPFRLRGFPRPADPVRAPCRVLPGFPASTPISGPWRMTPTPADLADSLASAGPGSFGLATAFGGLRIWGTRPFARRPLERIAAKPPAHLPVRSRDQHVPSSRSGWPDRASSGRFTRAKSRVHKTLGQVEACSRQIPDGEPEPPGSCRPVLRAASPPANRAARGTDSRCGRRAA